MSSKKRKGWHVLALSLPTPPHLVFFDSFLLTHTVYTLYVSARVYSQAAEEIEHKQFEIAEMKRQRLSLLKERERKEKEALAAATTTTASDSC